MHKKVTYVAETGEDGKVLCVWVDERGQRSARPFNPKRNRVNQIASAEVFGADPEAIKNWIDLQLP